MALEFAEFLRNFVPIGIQADLDSVSEELLLADLVPAGSSVLEIVRGESVSATLMAKDCSVDLIDFGRFEGVDGFSTPPTPRPAYAVVVLSDVLGYAREPVRLLRQCRSLLADGGFVLTAMPNFGYGALRLALVNGAYGEFVREQETNPRLHFFTLDLIASLLARAGYRIEETLRRTVPWNGAARDDRYADPDDAVLAQIRRDPEHATFSFVVKTLPIVHVSPGKPDSEDSVPALRKQLESVRADLAAAEVLNEELREAGRALREEVSAQRQRARLAERFQRELDAVMSDLSAAFAQRDDVLVRLHATDLTLSKMTQERDAMSGALQQSRGELERSVGEFKRTSADLQKRVEKVKGANADLQKRAERAESANADLQKRVEKVEDTNENLQKRAERAESANADLQKRVEKVEGTNENLQKRAEKAEGTALELAGELLQATKAEIQQLSDLIEVVQRSRFWRVKHFLRNLRGLLVR